MHQRRERERERATRELRDRERKIPSFRGSFSSSASSAFFTIFFFLFVDETMNNTTGNECTIAKIRTTRPMGHVVAVVVVVDNSLYLVLNVQYMYEFRALYLLGFGQI